MALSSLSLYLSTHFTNQSNALLRVSIDVAPGLILFAARSGNAFQLSFNGTKGVGYELQNSSDLSTWTVIEVIAPLPASETVTRQFPVQPGSTLYRLRTR